VNLAVGRGWLPKGHTMKSKPFAVGTRTAIVLKLSLGVLAACAAPTWADAPPSYQVQYLGDGWTGTGMNEHGDVCGSMSPDGTSLLAGVSHAGLPFEVLPLPPGMLTSRAFDINDAGVIVGAVCPNIYVISQPTAAVWTPSPSGYTVQVLSALPGDPYCAAYSINNLGDIVGSSGHVGWNPSTGVRFTPGGTVTLPDGMLSADVNDQRVVLADTRLLDLDTGLIVTIPLPPGIWQGFLGAGLNNNNDFCGYIQGNSGCSTFPVRYRQGIGWEFIGGCATTTSATAINDRGDALLYVSPTGAGVSFVSEGFFSLGGLIAPSQGLWNVQYGGANAINNSRQILAAARQGASGPIGAVRLTPIVANCPADFNHTGGVSVQDIFDFLSIYFASAPGADFNNSGAISVQDIFDFLTAYFAGCA